ncbi:MAG TPA: SipW-dependent-type signal peptide-containing protein [Syntrophomonadaceae bacterium]|nr:SipW-dependent-type signal peptide-containing protein [Syntrophomonadaceae bacterium]
MKPRLIAVSTIALLVLLIAGTSMAWFSSEDSQDGEFKLGTVKVEVVEEGFTDVEGATATTYEKNAQVKSLGTKKTYVRVRLVPEWSNPSLPVSNVELNLALNDDWLLVDGHYYFKYYLTQNQISSLLLESVTFTELGEEYEGEIFKLHVIAEGVQITHQAWKDVWGIDSLPFTPNQPWDL